MFSTLTNHFRSRGLTIYSTPASVRAGWLSILACVEVVCAVIGYWWIAIYFHTQAHLWISICVAPLLLLRSSESVALGRQWFTSYTEGYPVAGVYDRARDSWDLATKRLLVALNLGASFALSAATTAFFIEAWLAPVEGWSLFWRSMVAGWLAANIGIATSSSLGVGGLSQTIDFMRGRVASHAGIIQLSLDILGLIFELVTPVIIAAAVATAVAAKTLGFIAALGVLAGTCTLFLVILLFRTGDFPFVWILLPIWGFGIGVGYVVRALGIRFAATALNLFSGWRAFPKNWSRTLFSTDFVSAPELIPGYGRKSRFNFTFLYSQLRSKPKWDEQDVFNVFLAIIYFTPAYAYRLSIKSTFWIYWPLAYIAADLPQRKVRPAVFLDKLSATPLAWVSAILAVSTIFGFVAVNFLENISSLWPSLQIAFQVAAIEFFLQLDWESQKPWTWLSLASAVASITLFIWAGQLRPEFKHGGVDIDTFLTIDATVRRMTRLARIGRVCTILLTLSLVLYFLLWRSPLQCIMRDYRLDYIGTLFKAYYGKHMPEGPVCRSAMRLFSIP